MWNGVVAFTRKYAPQFIKLWSVVELLCALIVQFYATQWEWLMLPPMISATLACDSNAIRMPSSRNIAAVLFYLSSIATVVSAVTFIIVNESTTYQQIIPAAFIVLANADRFVILKML